MRILISSLALMLGVFALTGCANKHELTIIGPDPSATSADATPKLDIRDASYIEVVRGGHEGGSRFELEIPRQGAATFRVVGYGKHSESKAMSPKQTKELIETLRRNRFVASEDVEYFPYHPNAVVVDGTQEYLFVVAHDGKRFLLTRDNAPDPGFDWLWGHMQAQALSLLGTFKSHKIKWIFGPSMRLKSYRDSVPREIN